MFATLRWSGLAFLVRETIQRHRVTIVDYHEVTPDILDHHLTVLRKRYNFLALRDYVEAVQSGGVGALPAKPLVVTIDDGHKSVYELADVCRRHGVRPTVFLCSGIVGTARGFWWRTARSLEEATRWKRMDHDARMEVLASRGFSETRDFPERTALSRSEIDETREVFDFQAHTVFHPILTTCSDERSWFEIERAKRDLEQEYGLDVYAFAYPDGAYSDREIGYLLGTGYTCAVTTDAGYNGSNPDLYRLKRIGMGETGSTWLPSESAARTTDANEVVVRACGLLASLKQLLSRQDRSRSRPEGPPTLSPARRTTQDKAVAVEQEKKTTD